MSLSQHVYPTRQESVGCAIQRAEHAARWTVRQGWPEPTGGDTVVNGSFVEGCAACRSGRCVQMVVSHGPRRTMVVHEAQLS